MTTPSPPPFSRWLPIGHLKGALFLLISFSVELAQLHGDGNADNLSKLSLDDLFETKVITIKSASLREQPSTEAPASISVVTHDDIQRLGYQNLADILAGERGFYTSSDRNYTYLGDRGFGRQGDYNSRVLVLVDGHRMNDNVTGGVTLGNGFMVDSDLIERVEVVRGPGSALYGNNAFFAVVNVITRTGKDISGVETAFSGGSFESYRGRITMGYELDHGIDFLASGTVFHSDGHDQLFYKEYVQPPTSDGYSRHTDAEEAESGFARLSWNGIKLEGGWVERTKHIPTGSFSTVFGDPRNSTVDGNYYVSATLDHTFENDLTLNAEVSYDTIYYKGRYVYADASSAIPGATTESIEHLLGRWWTEDIHAHRTWFDQLTITAGFQIVENVDQNQWNYETQPYHQTLNANHHSIIWSPYIDSSWAILTNLILSAGFRYDQGDFVGSSLSPRTSLVYSPAHSTTFKLLYGQAFRGPNAYERFYSDGGLTQKGNPNLGPETIETYEWVAEQKLGQHFTASVSAYYYIANDLINQVIDPADQLLVYKNISNVRGRGVEAEIDGEFGGGIRGRISYTLQKTVDEGTSSELNNSPRNLIQGHLIVPFFDDRFSAGAEIRYISKRERDPSGESPGYYIANLTLFSRPIWHRLELSASIYNILGRRYFDPSPIELLQPVLEQDGRTFLVKLTAHF